MTKRFYSSPAWRQVRALVLKRDRHRCVVCSYHGRGLTVDHIIPLKVAPDLALNINNLRTLCKSCDNKRHSEKSAARSRPSVDINGYNLPE